MSTRKETEIAAIVAKIEAGEWSGVSVILDYLRDQDSAERQDQFRRLGYVWGEFWAQMIRTDTDRISADSLRTNFLNHLRSILWSDLVTFDESARDVRAVIAKFAGATATMTADDIRVSRDLDINGTQEYAFQNGINPGIVISSVPTVNSRENIELLEELTYAYGEPLDIPAVAGSFGMVSTAAIHALPLNFEWVCIIAQRPNRNPGESQFIFRCWSFTEGEASNAWARRGIWSLAENMPLYTITEAGMIRERLRDPSGNS